MSTYDTPMMKQYLELKEAHSDCLLFFRLGDFYELFLEDAEIGAKVLDITLTSRTRGKDGRIPMAGVPYHAVDSYLSKLVRAGYKVAICEQVSEPSGGILVQREVVRIVTPGTVLDDRSLQKNKNNYVVSVSLDEKTVGFAFADISTGEFLISEHPHTEKTLKPVISQEISRFSPSECILSHSVYNDPVFLKHINFDPDLNIYPYHNWELYASDYKSAKQTLEKHFEVATLHAFALDQKPSAAKAAAALLSYLKHTQKGQVEHITTIKEYTSQKVVEIDRATMVNLELFSTIREGQQRGSLIGVIDQTKTAMGGRLLRKWMMRPLYDLDKLEQRFSTVELFKKERELRKRVVSHLDKIYDTERLLSKISVGVGNARDLTNLTYSLEQALKIKNESELQEITKGIDPKILEVIKFVQKFIVDEPPIDLKEGGLIKKGINSKIDSLREIVLNSKEWLSHLEKTERERTGVSSLKVKYNKVFGYYIEISKANLESVPENYIRKQTLVNAERFITPELKEQEEVVLNASEELKDIEYKMYLEVVQEVLKYIDLIQRASKSIAKIDCLINFAELAERYDYKKPHMNTTGVLDIKNGRHPVVERLVDNHQFVPNDTFLDTNKNQLTIITGPNMAGKSVYLRQVAVITLMAHMGCFVPATSANISLVDRIFVRSGASDVISQGLSTFMVEMIEAAYILNHATKESLIVMDEIGRGTSTYDGISIASAIAEYLVTHFDNGGPKTLFATHYHELQALEKRFEGINNAQVVVKHENGDPVFLHKVVEGGASHSFGVAVAKLAGVPADVVARANSILEKYENSNSQSKNNIPLEAAPKVETSNLIKEKLSKIDPQNMTPIEALAYLSELKDEVCLK